MRASSRRDAVLAAAAVLFAASPALAHPFGLSPEPPPTSEYFALGVEHIVTGFDHLLFLLGLVVIAVRVRDVLWAVTAFTLAHSVTLALAALGLVAPDPAWVEPLIALSIAYVGLENLFARAPTARVRLAFGFGLLHGLGFAGALAEVGLPSEQRLAALLLFNLGVEAGQLALLALLLPLLWRLRRFRPAQRFGLPALNVALVAFGLVWAGDRLPELGGEDGVAQASGEGTRDKGGPAAAGAAVPRSVYPAAGRDPVDPRVQQLCAALHELPRARRAQCKGRPTGITLTAECTRMLDAAVDSGALTMDEGAARECVDAMRQRYADCDFTAARVLPAVPACTQVWRGALEEGERCRSSLECARGQHCRGASPLDTGVCAEAAGVGEACGTAVDPLGSYLPHVESEHAECEGKCVNARCRAGGSG